MEHASLGIQHCHAAGPVLTPREVDADEVHEITLPPDLDARTTRRRNRHRLKVDLWQTRASIAALHACECIA